MDFEGMTPYDAAKKIAGDNFPEHAFSKYTWAEAISNITTACQHFSNEALERARRWNHQAAVKDFMGAESRRGTDCINTRIRR